MHLYSRVSRFYQLWLHTSGSYLHISWYNYCPDRTIDIAVWKDLLTPVSKPTHELSRIIFFAPYFFFLLKRAAKRKCRQFSQKFLRLKYRTQFALVGIYFSQLRFIVVLFSSCWSNGRMGSFGAPSKRYDYSSRRGTAELCTVTITYEVFIQSASI